jgi:hypothetical protein
MPTAGSKGKPPEKEAAKPKPAPADAGKATKGGTKGLAKKKPR